MARVPDLCPCLPFDIYPFIVLLFICFLTFGSYWVYDTPGAIQTQITAWFGGPDIYTDSDNLTLYSVYSYPNILLALFGGLIIDKFLGIGKSTLLFCSLVFLGELVFALGIQWRMYALCVVGRLIFGLGGESLTVGQNYYTTKWFEKNISLAFGVVLAFSRIGSAVNFAITPIFAEFGVPFSVWFGVILCLMSLAACISLFYADWYASARFPAKSDKAGDDVQISHILNFPAQSWVIFFICVFFYVAILTFYTVASDIMQHTGFKYDPNTATFFLLIPNLVAIPCTPIFGFSIDKFGKSLVWMMVSSTMVIIAHVVFLLMSLNVIVLSPIPIMIWLGIGYSMFAASIWPLLPFVIRAPLLGTGYGLMTSIQNAGLAVFPQIIGAIQVSLGNSSLKYIIPIFIFASCATVALCLSIFLLFLDRAKTGGVLNMDTNTKENYKKQLNEQDVDGDDGVADVDAEE